MLRLRIDISKVHTNSGQIEGLPKNPRLIKDGRFQMLVKSIQSLPEMTEARDLLVYPYGGDYVVIGGNMRLRAYQELGWKEVPCCVLPENMPVSKLREIVIQDNNPFGETDWNMIANEWDVEELKDWGVDLPEDWDVEELKDWGVDLPEDWDVSPNEFGDGFSLPDGEKKPFQQMTFTFSDMEVELIKSSLETIKANYDFKLMDFGGNENSNGNVLYLIVKQWDEQRK